MAESLTDRFPLTSFGPFFSSTSSSPAWLDDRAPLTPSASETSLGLDALEADLHKLNLLADDNNDKINLCGPAFVKSKSRSRRRRLHNTQTMSKKSRKIMGAEASPLRFPTATFTFGESRFAKRWSELTSASRSPTPTEEVRGLGVRSHRSPLPTPSEEEAKEKKSGVTKVGVAGVKRYVYVASRPATAATAVSTRDGSTSDDPVGRPDSFAPFPFLDLPTELREMTYRAAVAEFGKQRLCLSADRRTGQAKVSRIPYSSFSLVSSSRQLRAEALPILYQSHDFYTRSLRTLPSIIRSMGPGAARNIRRLELCFWGAGKGDRRAELLAHAEHLQLLPKLEWARFDLDYHTVRAMMVGLGEGTRLCRHHTAKAPEARRDYGRLFQLDSRRDQLKIGLTFTRGRRTDGDGSEVGQHKWPLSDCVCCAVMCGLEKIWQANQEAASATGTDGGGKRDKTTEAEMLVLRRPLNVT